MRGLKVMAKTLRIMPIMFSGAGFYAQDLAKKSLHKPLITGDIFSAAQILKPRHSPGLL